VAEEHDDSQKTEAPSQRRLDEARAKGQLVVSREVATMLLFGTAALLAAAPGMAQGLAVAGRALLADAHLTATDGPGLARLALALSSELGWGLALPFLALFLAPLAAAVLQKAVVWTAEPLQPKLERISPLAGVKRLFSTRALIELAKSLLKLVLVGGALAWLFLPELPRIVAAGALPPGPLLGYLHDLLGRALMVLAVAAAAVAAADYAH
jgi:flagellar biosynthetic protein FlhB